MKYPFLVIGTLSVIFLMGDGHLPVVPSASRTFERIANSEKKIAGMLREVTAYNVGVAEQTSGDSCIGAGGHDLCELVKRKVKVCAANFVPLGTKLHIEGYGEYIVLDRMHRRFSHRVDIAMNEDEIGEAIEFGVRKCLVEEKL
jgi:3D (Asp-Asp-Asp) domain-containing protein